VLSDSPPAKRRREPPGLGGSHWKAIALSEKNSPAATARGSARRPKKPAPWPHAGARAAG